MSEYLIHFVSLDDFNDGRVRNEEDYEYNVRLFSCYAMTKRFWLRPPLCAYIPDFWARSIHV